MPQVAEKTMDLYSVVGAFDWTEERNRCKPRGYWTFNDCDLGAVMAGEYWVLSESVANLEQLPTLMQSTHKEV